tara:strand:- start:619 stop:843 length:225 start_codon:yes stop_codon:yes gene_type:complete
MGVYIVPGGLFNSEDLLHASAMGEGLGIGDLYGFGDGLQIKDALTASLGTFLLFIVDGHLESRTKNKYIHLYPQ